MLPPALPLLCLAAAAMLLVSGCAQPQAKGLEDMRLTPELVDKVQKEGKVELSGRDGVICRAEMPTGSHRMIWRCDTVEGARARADANQKEILDSQMGAKPKVF